MKRILVSEEKHKGMKIMGFLKMYYLSIYFYQGTVKCVGAVGEAVIDMWGGSSLSVLWHIYLTRCFTWSNLAVDVV